MQVCIGGLELGVGSFELPHSPLYRGRRGCEKHAVQGIGSAQFACTPPWSGTECGAELSSAPVAHRACERICPTMLAGLAPRTASASTLTARSLSLSCSNVPPGPCVPAVTGEDSARAVPGEKMIELTKLAASTAEPVEPAQHHRSVGGVSGRKIASLGALAAELTRPAIFAVFVLALAILPPNPAKPSLGHRLTRGGFCRFRPLLLWARDVPVRT